MIVEKLTCTARAPGNVGREGGRAHSSDGRLDVETPPPANGSGATPEQLFAAAWSTCLISAIKSEAARRKMLLPPVVVVDTEVDLGIAEGGYVLRARIDVRLPGLEPRAVQALAAAAYPVCPCSKPMHGNCRKRRCDHE